MNSNNTNNNNLIPNNFNTQELMKLEKIRLGFNPSDLVFVSTGDFSKFHWCPMQAYFALIDHELDKFLGYLQDKIEYSIKLDKLTLQTIPNNPKSPQKLLQIGDDITLQDISKLLKRTEYANIPTQQQIIDAKENLKKCTLQTQRGHYLETIYAKKYPQIHWFVKYKNFIFTCEPDGITNDFVYEFKSSKNRYFANHTKRKAQLQSDIYAICFNKTSKTIDQLIISENKIETIEESLNKERLDSVIKAIKNIIAGNLPKAPLEKFKCRVCMYRNKCEI